MMQKVDPEIATLVRKHAIKALFSDDELMEQLVLKGGNLLGVVYEISTRTSVDLDFSIAGELGDLEGLRARIEKTLKTNFSEIGYEVFDVMAEELPEGMTPDLAEFWGGYYVNFKLIEKDKFVKLKGDLEQIRRNAVAVGKRGSTKFEIDISKHEFCDTKRELAWENLTIYVYTPLMVIAEKIRALCQQMPQYVAIAKNHPRARARDFLDIHTVSVKCKISFAQNAEMVAVLRSVFEAKRASLNLLCDIAEYREFHRADFPNVQSTVPADFGLKDFDFYFNFVLDSVSQLLESLGNK